MKESTCPRLCGGTFFTLVLQGLKQRTKAREHYRGERDGSRSPCGVNTRNKSGLQCS